VYKRCVLVGFLLLSLISANANAENMPGRVLLLAKASYNVEHAVKKVKKRYQGKVLKAEKIKSKGPVVFKVKVLMPGGRIKNVYVDGTSGDVFEP